MRRQKIDSYVALIAITLMIASCGPDKPVDSGTTTGSTTGSEPVKTHVTPPDFNADSAFSYVQLQSDMGPRTPGSKAHAACVKWMSETLKTYGAEVVVQDGIVTTFDQKKWKAQNVIGSFNPEKKDRVLLAAHFDSRPFCDYDSLAANKTKACPGVNDGASGVGVLMEIARNISKQNPAVGIDILMLDMEDYGQPEGSNFPPMQDSWCLGAQYWSKNPHKQGYFANYGILLDMVGGKNATFYKEGQSIFFAGNIVDKVWNTASTLGYGNYFIQEPYGEFTDDHVYINRITNIPTIDIINYDKERGAFFSHHHKAGDTMDNIDKNTLKAVGQTVMEVIYNEK